MNQTFNGKVALITGAGSGIGQAAAQLLAEQGANVALLGRTRSELEETAAAIPQNGDNTLIVEADISDYDAMETAVAKTVDKWGRLDIVFANAGINGVWAPIEKLTPDEWEKTVRINLNGTFFTVKTAVPYLKKQGGSVIITSSVNGTRMFCLPTAFAARYPDSSFHSVQTSLDGGAAGNPANGRVCSVCFRLWSFMLFHHSRSNW